METLNKNIINQIISSSQIIIDKTNESDHLIFIGQSPDYFSYLVSKRRKVSRIPISGRVFNDKWSIPSEENLNKYFQILDKFKLSYSNIILIDHSHSGKSIECFSKILNRYFNFINRTNFQYDYLINVHAFNFINLISIEQQNGWIKKPNRAFVNTIGYVIIPDLVDFANEKYPRTTNYFPYFKWEIQPDLLVDNSNKENYKTISKIIDQHIELNQYNPNVYVNFRYQLFNYNTIKK